LAWTILQPSGFAQNFSEGFLLPGILNGNMVVSATGDGAVPLVDANDIARVAAATLINDRHAGSVLEITGPQAITFDDAVAIIGAVSGREIIHRRLTSDEFQAVLGQFGVPAEYAAMLVRDQEAIRAGVAGRSRTPSSG
jgi:uncharacterized protein YbjT (DUF2867 family)